jgi:hypothetical protein
MDVKEGTVCDTISSYHYHGFDTYYLSDAFAAFLFHPAVRLESTAGACSG